MISAEERRLLPEFRARVQDLEFDWYDEHDLSLLKWMRARDLDLDKAEKMLRKSLIWRKDNDIDNVVTYDFPEDLTKEFPFHISGVDTDGCFVVVVPFGRWDLRKFADSNRQHLVLNYVDYLCEIMMTVLKKRSTPSSMIMQLALVLDYDGFSLRQIASKACVDMLIELLSRIESNRPEMLKKAHVVNAPRMFEIAFKLFKPIMSERTLAKLSIYGPNVSEWKTGLLSSLPHDSLPSNYGGSNISSCRYQFEDKDNIKVSNHKEFPDQQMSMMVVSPGETFEVQMDVYQSDVLRWSFKTEHNDIGFQLYNENGETLVECSRADAHKFKQNGTLVCTSTGTYTLCFDNSYSRFSSKRLWYAVSVSD